MVASQNFLHWARWAGRAAVALLLVAGVGMLLLWLAGKFAPKVPMESGAPAAHQQPPAGRVVSVRSVSVPLSETAVGTIRAVHETSIGSKLLARVVEVNLKAGQKVRRGDVLVRLDDTDLQARLKQAQAAVAAAEAAHAQAEADATRYAKLFKASAVSQQEYERATTALKSTDAELRRAREAINEVQATLDLATMRSPMDGIVIDKQVDVGDMVSPGQTLATLLDPGEMQLVASVRESLAHRLRIGQRIDVQIEDINKQCTGTVSEIVPEAEAASRAFQVKVTGPCPAGVYSGMFGRLLIPLDDEQVLVVPRRRCATWASSSWSTSSKTAARAAGRSAVAARSATTWKCFPASAKENASSCRPQPPVVRRPMAEQDGAPAAPEHNFTNKIVKIFLESNLSLILILLASIVGLAALGLTPREEDPQIVVPLADIYVNFPGHSAAEVEQLVATPLEKILYQIDGVEYVYSMSREGQAIITVRYYVGEDRERSLVKLYKKIDENVDIVPPGVTGWVIKPVEIDDVPVVTLTLSSAGADDMTLRRVAEELAQRLAAIQDVSRAYVVGGRPRVVQVLMDPDRMAGYHVSPLGIAARDSGHQCAADRRRFPLRRQLIRVDAGEAFEDARQLRDLVVGVFDGRPVFLKDVARVDDGPDEVASYVRHGWGPARGFTSMSTFPARPWVPRNTRPASTRRSTRRNRP